MDFNDEVMHKVWKYELDILNVIHNICKEKHLRYSLFFGTLLGAVRHGGFIPWDDDIDIIMPRRDYEKLMKIWDGCAPDGYILQKPDKDSDYINNFAKVRKDHTTFLQSENELKYNYHKGIFVDIFPMDKVPNSKIALKIQYIFAAVNLLYSRGYTSGSGGMIGIIEKIFLHVPKSLYPTLRDISATVVQFWNQKKGLQYVCCSTIKECKVYFPANMFSSLRKISFEGKKYYSVTDIDTVLRICYGDYMQLPPKNERVWYHHPIVVDFEKNYEELGDK